MGFKEQHRSSEAEPELVYETDAGQMYCGESPAFLETQAGRDLHGRVQLAFTSPPFPLIEKKKYGNLQGEEYVDWFAQASHPNSGICLLRMGPSLLR